jgi:hypothetical protein
MRFLVLGLQTATTVSGAPEKTSGAMADQCRLHRCGAMMKVQHEPDSEVSR